MNKGNRLCTEHKRLHKVWQGMKARCYNRNEKSYYNYGGRGITVCDEWLGEDGFYNFFNWAMENGYDEEAPKGECTLDRINNYKGYSPDNCRWISIEEQNKNKRNPHKDDPCERFMIEFAYEFLTLMFSDFKTEAERVRYSYIFKHRERLMVEYYDDYSKLRYVPLETLLI